MNHNINFNFIHKNIITFSILSQKKNSIFQIYKVDQNNKNKNKDNQIPAFNRDIITKISKDCSKRHDGVTKNLNIQKSENFSLKTNGIFIQKEKLSLIDKKDIKNENESLNPKKKLRKINKKVNSKEKKLNVFWKGGNIGIFNFVSNFGKFVLIMA